MAAATVRRTAAILLLFCLLDDENADLLWLSEYIEPEDIVIQKWKSTYRARQGLLKTEYISVYDYYNKFRCLTIHQGQCLLMYDFDKLHPNSENNLITRWPLLRDHLTRRLKECNKIKNVFDKALVILLPTLLEPVESAGCPEDSVVGDDGECKCVSPCPKHDCQPGQQPVRVKDAITETPGSCCPLYECRNQETVNLLTPEETMYLCMDSRGQPRELGEHWQDQDACKNCTCEATGPSCHIAMCQPCARPLPLVPGECCPRCPDTSLLGSCRPLLNCRIRCELGFDKDEAGCLICRCRSPAQNEVHKKPTDYYDEDEDVYEDSEDEKQEALGCPKLDCGQDCEHGHLLDAHRCRTCECRPRPDCPVSHACQRKCPQGYRTNKRGCLSCRCRVSCVDERNVTRPEGSSWSVESCRSCKCELGGQIRCSETVCSVACNEPLPPNPGQCCPLCPIQALEDSRGWGTVPIVLIVVLALLCVLLMVHLVRGRFRARLAPSEVSFAGFPQQYYKCVPVYETHVPVLRHAEKIAPL